MTQTLVCPDCGMAFDDPRQHREWHVDREMRRMKRDFDDLNARLNDIHMPPSSPHTLVAAPCPRDVRAEG